MNNIIKIENQYSWFLSDNETIKTILWKMLRFRARNYFHNVRYKMKVWDGFDDFFKKDSGRFLTGLLPEVQMVLRTKKIEYTINDTREPFKWNIDKIDASYLNEGPNPVAELRDYQVDYVNYVITNWRGLITSPTASGKAQPLDSKVYTPSGPVKMGDLKIGDYVCTPSGNVSKIINIYPQGDKDVYCITFTNGDKVECCADHLWKVDAIIDDWKDKIKDTKYLIENCHNPSGRPKYSIKTPTCVFFTTKPLQMNPYLMGALIGDGNLTNSIKFSNVDEEILNNVKLILQEDYHLRYIAKCDYAIVKKVGNNYKSKTDQKNIYVDAMRFYELMGKKSQDKFIPKDFKYNSIENRLLLIKGLMDTDGYVDQNGYLEYCTCSKQLSLDVKEVIESLGGMCRIRTKQSYYVYNNEKKSGKISYIISIGIQNSSALLNLTRKKIRCKNNRKNMMCRVISKIEKVGTKPCQCILIDNEDHLYLTDHMIPTHNTNTMKAIIKALPPKTPTLILANKRSLVHANYEEIKSLGIDWVGRLYDKKKDPNFITCATVQSAHLLKAILPKIKVLIVDEVHEMMSKIPKRVYNSLKNCGVRVGMSATPFKFGGKDECQKFEVKGYFGPIFLTDSTESGKLTTKELIDREILSTANCTFYHVNEPKLPYEIYLDAVTKGIAENEYFHKLVVKLVKKLTGRTLIIVERLAHGDRLQELMPNALWVRGKDDIETRQVIIERLKNEEGDVVAIATSGIFNTGINVFCHNLINAAGGQADHQIIQRFGRGLRRAKDKENLEYYDFMFNINDYLDKHSRRRVSILEKEGHKVTVLEKGIEP
jgi:superfamily II DNA or RNA helicase